MAVGLPVTVFYRVSGCGHRPSGVRPVCRAAGRARYTSNRRRAGPQVLEPGPHSGAVQCHVSLFPRLRWDAQVGAGGGGWGIPGGGPSDRSVLFMEDIPGQRPYGAASSRRPADQSPGKKRGGGNGPWTSGKIGGFPRPNGWAGRPRPICPADRRGPLVEGRPDSQVFGFFRPGWPAPGSAGRTRRFSGVGRPKEDTAALSGAVRRAVPLAGFPGGEKPKIQPGARGAARVQSAEISVPGGAESGFVYALG